MRFATLGALPHLPGKCPGSMHGRLQCLALQKVMSRFGINELARTGRISLKRGSQLLERGANFPRQDASVISMDDWSNSGYVLLPGK